MTRYCLDCGYSRQGLPLDAVCQECGEADSFEKQREVCAKLANKPLALLWRVMTLRRLPKGWWVVFEDKTATRFRPWQIFLCGALILMMSSTLGSFIRIESTTKTYLYDVNDPQQTAIQDVSVRTDINYLPAIADSYSIAYQQGLALAAENSSNVKSGKKRSTRTTFGRDTSDSESGSLFIFYLLTYTIVIWLLCRFIWLPLVACNWRETSFKHAAQQTYVIYVAHVLWLIAVSVMGSLVYLITSLASTIKLTLITGPFSVLLSVVMIFGQAILWSRLISTDNLKLDFPNRFSAGLILIGLTVLAVFAVFTWPWFW